MRTKFGFRFRILIAVLAMLWAQPLLAQVPQVPQVPQVIEFANMRLHLTEQARRDIQADVDALYRSPKYFYMKLERVDMYLPIIEPILAEHGVPDDVKYLVIQESALISDAVSSSKAVGFWQFKEASATEVGMRVDRHVDERMNIVASTTGAAKYLLKSNATFNNWLYSLQSYQMGLGGATRSLNDRYYGADEMRIDSDTYWYVKKFLSHLVAFRDAVGKEPRSLMLYQHKNCANKTLEDIALEFNTEHDLLVEYNKWLKTNRVPDDKEYVVIVPVELDEAPNLLAESEATAPDKQKHKNKRQSFEDKVFGEKQKEPELAPAVRDQLVITKINGIQAAVARPGDNSRDLAKAGGVSVASFLKYNDIRPGDVLKPGQVYYFRKKKKKATVYRHVVAEGETLWDISQKYGVRMDKLLQKNRMRERDGVKPGQVVWLRYIRPANEPVAYEAVPKKKAQAEAALVSMEQGGSNTVQLASAAEPGRAEVKPVRNEARQNRPVQQAQEKPRQAAVAVKEQPLRVQEPQKEQIPVQSKPVAVQSPENRNAPEQNTATPEPAPAQAGANEYSQPSATVAIAADTPVISEPARAKVKPKQQVIVMLPEAEPADSLVEESHVYPADSIDERNIFPESKENTEAVAVQVTEQKKDDPDSFAVHGPVKFIGEEDPLLEQQPIRTAPAQKQDLAAAQPQAAENAAVATASAPDTVHVVKAGETLYGIGKLYGLSVQELRERNNMAANAVLSVGQALQLKQVQKAAAALAQSESSATNAQEGETTASAVATPTSEDDRYLYHAVAEGETMYRVARKYNVTIKDIMEWNRKEDFSIRPGEVLVVGRK
ncbi:LysM peptidoglycan-binding domain-containing protein [Cesiribacter sp. SM1]|uniref:LysM peptidoglycan-binding domain-containing protein n=1 Tax=Cesiribacter sp. SM1 TaxID=2861196 RepID=UPI001CD707C5|nr:LysM peptidoglycan-binding domain-containing protein [Cesiribacter sp. SM1]